MVAGTCVLGVRAAGPVRVPAVVVDVAVGVGEPAALVAGERGARPVTVEVGCRVRRNEAGREAEGRVVRLEHGHAVIRWDTGGLRLTSVRVADIHDGGRPRSSRYSLIGGT